MTEAPLPARRPHRTHLMSRRQRDLSHPRPRRERSGPTSIRLWLPLTPLWLVLSPFALLLAPLVTLAPEMRGVRPYRAVWAIGGVLLSMSGTHVIVEAPGATVRIRIF